MVSLCSDSYGSGWLQAILVREEIEIMSDLPDFLKNVGWISNYRLSGHFQKEVFISEDHYLNEVLVDSEDFKKRDETLLSKLAELTGINFVELKGFLGDSEYYNMLLFFYEVSSALTILDRKNDVFENYIKIVLNSNKMGGLFRNFNENKFRKILSLF